jgi:hypothetical protein
MGRLVAKPVILSAAKLVSRNRTPFPYRPALERRSAFRCLGNRPIKLLDLAVRNNTLKTHHESQISAMQN